MRGIEYLLWIIGLVCIGNVAVGKWQTAHAQTQSLQTFKASKARNVISAQSVDQSMWSQERVDRFDEAKNVGGIPTATAVLSIPKIDLQVAVFDGTSDHLLDLGAGRVKGTALFGDFGNIAIAGHRDGFFRGLKDVKEGDSIDVEHEFGTDSYRITKTLVVKPDDVSVLAKTDPRTLTLITCYPFYYVGSAPQRYIVQATWQHSK